MYRLLFPKKPYEYIGYYPYLKYLKRCKSDLKKDRLNLSFSGKISAEKGFSNFIEVVKILSEEDKQLKIKIKIIGWFDETEKDKNTALLKSFNSNVEIELFKIQPFENYLSLINDTDIFLDLRTDDFENQRCLPIKLFYYAGLGRPVIYSDLKAIRKEVAVEKFGFLVKPGDAKHIAQLIKNYLSNSPLYQQHCENARDIIEKEYNWKKIENNFISFLNRVFEKDKI